MILMDLLAKYSKLPYDINAYVKELDSIYIKPNNIIFNYPDDAIGIEIELENAHSPSYSGYYWTGKEDGSLRNRGIEYVTPVGMSLKHIKTALEELFSQISEVIETSARTSVHIHMNVLDLTEQQIRDLISIYGLAEYSLYEFAGSKRYKNIFCVPLIKSDLIGLLNHDDFLLIPTKWTKYCGLNLSTILKYGTIEFRQLRGTYDIPTIVTWIRLLWKMKEYVLTHNSAHIENMIIDNPQEFLKDVFDPYTRFLKIEENILADAQLFVKATMFKGEIQKEIEEFIKPKPKKVNSIALDISSTTPDTSQVVHTCSIPPPAPPVVNTNTYNELDDFLNSLEPQEVNNSEI